MEGDGGALFKGITSAFALGHWEI